MNQEELQRMIIAAVVSSAAISALLTTLLNSIFSFIRDRYQFNREMKKTTYLKILEKSEKSVGYHFTYYTKLIEMQKVFEELSVGLTDYPNNADGLESLMPKLSEVITIINKLQQDYQIEANAIFLYVKSSVFDDWYDNKLNLMNKYQIEFKVNLDGLNTSLATHSSLVEGEYMQQHDEWKKVMQFAGRVKESLDKIIPLAKEYISVSKELITEVQNAIPDDYRIKKARTLKS